jgi:hypothetical protein
MNYLRFLIPLIAVISLNAREWVEKFNSNSQILPWILAKHFPENAGRIGVDGYDKAIRDLTILYEDRYTIMQ